MELGYGKLAEDSFLDVHLKLGYSFDVPQLGCSKHEEPSGCQTKLRLAAQAPLRFRVADAAPADDSLLRRADWDEPSDYLRVVRSIEYGRPTEALHLKIGELGPISLGHGTLVRDYYNVITTDHFQLGAAGGLNTVYGGFEMLLDNVVAPSVVGGRVFVNPWAFVDKDSFLSRIALGATMVSDINAPTHLAAASPTSVAVDDALNPVVIADQVTTLVGADVEIAAVDTDFFGLVPYADFNHHVSLGSGVHVGTFVTLRPLDSLELLSQLEFRRVGQHYLPDYVGPLYEIERYQFAGWSQRLPAPKVRAAASLNNPASNGFYASLTARMPGLFSVSAAFSDHQGPANQMLRLRASATPIRTVQMGLFYQKQNFDKFSDVLDLDGALVAAESRIGVYGPTYVLGRYGRMWRLSDDGRYQTVDDWSLGLGASMAF